MATFRVPQLGLSSRLQTGLTGRFTMTISLSIDYAGSPRVGDWVVGRADVIRRTCHMVFLQGLATVRGAVLTRACGVFRIGSQVDEDDFWLQLRRAAPRRARCRTEQQQGRAKVKALRSHLTGGPDTLRLDEIDPPNTRAGQLLVRVAAVSLNYPDALMIEDRYQFRPERPFAPGGELSGTVVAVGEDVAGFAVGDRVMAMTGFGALAEIVAVDAVKCFVLPNEMPFDEASALLFTYATTIHGLLDRAGLKAGETMLVLGAAGGIGISAIELGKAIGARVVAAVSSAEKAEAARSVGADDVVIYPRAPLDATTSRVLVSQFKAAAPGGFDVVYDPVGGDYAEPALRSIAWEGRYAVIGFTGGIPKIPLNLALLKACSIVGVFFGTWSERNRARCAEEVTLLLRFWEEGKIRPRISERFSLAQAPLAIAKLSDRGAVGKIVIEMAS